MRKYVLTPQFQKLLSDGNEGEARESTLIKAAYFELAADAGSPDKPVTFVASTGDRDRYGDRVSPKGWKLKQFRKNPVILWSHEHDLPPVGKSVKTWVEDGALYKAVEFQPSDLYPFGHMIGEMVRRRFLHAASVGFNALKFKPTEAGDGENAEELKAQHPWALDFVSQELLESSIVTVPANPFALSQAKAAGIDTAPMAEHACRILDNDMQTGPLLGRKWYEQAHADTSQPIVTVDMGAHKAAEPEQPAQEREMEPREKLAEARKQLAEAKSQAQELASEMQAAIVDACGDLESAIKDCAEMGIDLAGGTIDRLKNHAHKLSKVLPTPPAPEPVVTEEKSNEPSADDLAEVIERIGVKVPELVDQALAAHTGRLTD